MGSYLGLMCHKLKISDMLDNCPILSWVWVDKQVTAVRSQCFVIDHDKCNSLRCSCVTSYVLAIAIGSSDS
jgi:hypothetical protein